MPPITMIPVQSSQIAEYGHDPETGTMAIRFLNGPRDARVPGPLYHYSGVDADTFAAFEKAESKGSHFGQVFKKAPDRFPFTRIDESKKEE